MFLRHAVRRLAFAAILVFTVASGALLLARLVPGDYTASTIRLGTSPEAIARERARLGLDRPLVDQYASWLGRAVRFDFGESYRYQRPVRELVGDRLRNTAMLGATALLLATLIGVPLGVVSGSRPGWWARVIRAGSIVVLSVPPLISSLLLALLAARTGWFPVGGLPSRPAGGWLGALPTLAWHLTLPALALALPFAATLEQLQSQSIAVALAAPHIAAARSRGVPPARLVWRHALRVAIRPVAAVYGIIIGSLFSGSFAVEMVTTWPGLGRLMVEGLRSRDTYLVAGCAAMGAVVLAIGTFLSDLLLLASDPRLRQEAP
jgi:peptide/nickel transport system permease protein